MPERLLRLYLRTSSGQRVALTIVDPRDGLDNTQLDRIAAAQSASTTVARFG